MKYANKSSKFLTMCAMALIAGGFTTSCVKSEPNNNGNKTEDVNDFDFATTKSVKLDVKYSTAVEGYRVLFEVYDENPLVIDSEGQVVKREGLTPKIVRMTNNNGEYTGTDVVPGYVDGDVYIYTTYIGVPMLCKAQIENGQLNADVNWDSMYNMNSSTDNAPMSRATYATNIPEGYAVFGDWDKQGRPDYLDADGELTVTSEILDAINEVLPEDKNCPKELRQSVDFEVTKPAQVKVRFVGGTSSAHSTFGYYCYPSGASADEIRAAKRYIVFPNTRTGEGLKGGECVALHYIDTEGVDRGTKFPAGVKIGWFLINSNFNERTGYLRFADNLLTVFSTTALNNNNNTRTAAFRIDDFLVLGFEDWNSQDYNDVLFNVWANPIEAIVTPDVPSVTPSQPSTDKVAYSVNYKGILAFEDLWPSTGDYDLNDAVVKYTSRIDFNMYNEAVGTEDTFTPLWCGAYYRNGFCYQMNVDRSNVESSMAMDADLNLATFNVIEDMKAAAAAQKPVTITNRFKTPVSEATLGVAPFNPFININKGDWNRKEVHLVNYKPTDKADMTLFGTGSDKSKPSAGLYYVSSQEFPFAINLADAVEYFYTKEAQRIDITYPRFSTWVTSDGKQDADWYLNR